ncbi:MAG: hypothetical protein AB7O44_29720 [Hyphomicrobiaceae bacterium]
MTIAGSNHYVVGPPHPAYVKSGFQPGSAIEALERTEIKAGFLFDDLDTGLNTAVDEFLRCTRLQAVEYALLSREVVEQIAVFDLECCRCDLAGCLLEDGDLPILHGNLVRPLRRFLP